jgi:hypothetical protein
MCSLDTRRLDVFAQNTNDYHVYFKDWWQRDLSTMVRRSLNHPSIVMWSIGNEIPMRETPEGISLYHQLAGACACCWHTCENHPPIE